MRILQASKPEYICSQLQNCVMEIALGSPVDLHSRPDCSLCAFLLESIARNFPTNDSLTAWSIKTAYLRFTSDETHTESSQGAKVYLCVSGEPTEVLLRVYDGHNFEQIAPEWQSTYDAAAPRSIPQCVDWSRFQRLVFECVQKHPECRSVGDRTFPPGFCLIDVERRKVVRFSKR
jgi:hypothetical protein